MQLYCRDLILIHCSPLHYYLFITLIVDAFYIRWGNNVCLAGEINLYSGHIVESNNANNADGNYLCLPDAHNAYPPQTQNPVLNLEDIKDAKGNTIPCAACAAASRSAVFTYPDNSVCPSGWNAEYTGYLAANPKWPGENICVDITYGTQLSQTPCDGLAVITKGALNSYGSAAALACVVCSI